MEIVLGVLLVALSAFACLTQSMPVLKIAPPPNIYSYITYRYRTIFALVAVALAGSLAAQWIDSGMSGWFAPLCLILSGLIWASLVATPALLFRPFQGKGRVLPAAEATMVSDDSTVVGVVIRSEPRAYPEQMLMPQHVINDRVAGRPITISWCPLCHSGMVFDGVFKNQWIDPRVVGGGNNNVLIYDATSKNMFQQITGEILEGPDKGSYLDILPSMITTWGQWKAEHPTTTVWWRSPGTLFESVTRALTLWAPTTILDKQKPFYAMSRPADRRLGYTETVSGVDVHNHKRAYPETLLAAQPVVNDVVNELPLVVFSRRRAALVRFFDRRVKEGVLTFRAVPEEETSDGIVAADVQTQSRWNLDGMAVDGPLKGLHLQPVPSITRCFWFAFAYFYPDADICAGDARDVQTQGEQRGAGTIGGLQETGTV